MFADTLTSILYFLGALAQVIGIVLSIESYSKLPKSERWIPTVLFFGLIMGLIATLRGVWKLF